MNPRKLLIALAAALVLAAPAGAVEVKAQQGSGPMEMKSTGTPGKVAGARALRIAATVKAIDLASREITLEGTGKGKTEETFKVGSEVENLDQVHAGDRVVIDYVQGLMMQLQPPGEAPVNTSATVDAARAAPGGQPAAGVVTTAQGTVTITAIDMKSRMVTFQGPEGGIHRVKAGPEVHLEKAKVGDKLVATYTEALAVKVVPATKAKQGKKTKS